MLRHGVDVGLGGSPKSQEWEGVRGKGVEDRKNATTSTGNPKKKQKKSGNKTPGCYVSSIAFP
jgi:hypothetical protein